MKRIFVILVMLLFTVKVKSQLNIEWQKCMGGGDYINFHKISKTSDGGYIVAGNADSTNGNVSGNHGYYDEWVVKFNSTGSIQWQKCYGGKETEVIDAIKQTSDGGYIIDGITTSNDGDVSGNHGDSDGWIVKLNSSGNILWQKCLGGTESEVIEAINQTSDGGYIIAGISTSNDGDVSGNHGNSDGWIVKLNSTGNIQWQKCLGGSEDDNLLSIIQTNDGGYIAVGTTSSNDGDAIGNKNSYSGWVIKLNSAGNIIWQKFLGGTSGALITSVIQTSEGGYIIAGTTSSNDGEVSGNHGNEDIWIAKLNSSGSIQWQKCYGGSLSDQFSADFYIYGSLEQTNDGGYILCVNTTSNDGDVSGNHGNSDGWIVKLNSTGIIQWQKCIGGSKDEIISSAVQMNDGSYIIVGYSDSNDGDVIGNHENSNGWIIKLSSSGIIGSPTVLEASRCETGSGTLTLTALGANFNEDYKWYATSTGGNALQSNGSTYTTPVISSTTTYYVTKYNIKTGEESSPRIPVKAIINSPIISAGADQTICKGSSTTLTATSNASINWSDYSSDLNHIVSPTSTSTYYVTATLDGCTASDNVVVTVIEHNNNVDFSSPQQAYNNPPFAVQFNNNTPNLSDYNFIWDFGDNSNSSINNAQAFHTYNYNGLYDIKLIAINKTTGCEDSLVKTGYIYCSGGQTSVAVTGVTVSPTTLDIKVGNTGILSATIQPSNASYQNVLWSSSNPNIATVNSSGVVTAIAEGIAVITVKTVDGGKTAACTVNVKKEVGIDELQITNSELRIYPNPNNGRFVIEGKDLQGKAQIKVMNMLGAVVMDENRVINNNAIEINISSLPGGIYNVSVQTKDGVVMRKIVKE